MRFLSSNASVSVISDGGSSISVDDNGGALTVDGALASVGTITNVVHVDDNGGALTVDGSVTPLYTAFSILSDLSADETVASVKAAAGTLYGIDAYNPNATGVWVQMFDALVGAIVLGTTTPKFSMYIPATSGRDPFYAPNGDAFVNGISYAVTTTADGNTGPVADIQLTFRYV